ncbi:MAG: XdhC family protein [Candidatus Poseidoniaceae archaeon]|nr:XdhC family protein [Candidatus Poseidoniaceae archaeon]
MAKLVFESITSWLDAGYKVGVASVIDVSGSVPGKVGARLALTRDSIIGTVGGAGLEMQVIEKLRKNLNETKSPHGEIITFGLNKGAKGYEVIPLDSLCGGRVTVVLEVLIPMPHILLMGGGHCAKAIADSCNSLGWSYSVNDSRAEYAILDGAKESHHSCTSDFMMSESEESLLRFSDILLLGHDWKEDEERLISLLFSGYSGRIGVIGSRAKWQSFESAALAEGIEQEKLDSINCPIGLNIGAESPEEIAIAVLAEIMAAFKDVDPSKPNWRNQ